MNKRLHASITYQKEYSVFPKAPALLFSDFLVSYPGRLFGPEVFAEMQSVFSTARVHCADDFVLLHKKSLHCVVMFLHASAYKYTTLPSLFGIR